jgi:hypothetical protein
MLNVFLSVDVEIWCEDWRHIDAQFARAFEHYIYGPTARGRYGLPYQVAVLNAHGLRGVFFVEPLFSARFGAAPLAEIVGLLAEARQEVQLHLHTEWVDEARTPLLPGGGGKRQHLRQFSLSEQTGLIGAGKAMLAGAGARGVNAFRAGSFAFNRDSLLALAANGIAVDSSYNASMFGPDSGVMPGVTLVDATCCDGIVEYPMTVFDDGRRRLRHVQLTSCSFEEIEALLWQAVRAGRHSFMILSHSFELLNRSKDRADAVVVRRFRRLCAFLERHRDVFRTCGFGDLAPAPPVLAQPAPLRSPLWRTGARMAGQAWRWRYG